VEEEHRWWSWWRSPLLGKRKEGQRIYGAIKDDGGGGVFSGGLVGQDI
jgi:hypothetical protein